MSSVDEMMDTRAGKRPLSPTPPYVTKRTKSGQELDIKYFAVAHQIMDICIKRGLLGRVSDINETERIINCYKAFKKAAEERCDVEMSDIFYFCKFAETASRQGMIHPSEFQIVGSVYATFHKFVTNNNAADTNV